MVWRNHVQAVLIRRLGITSDMDKVFTFGQVFYDLEHKLGRYPSIREIRAYL